MRINKYFSSAAVVALLACAASASEDALGSLYRMTSDTESKIQTQVLDPMLGQGRAFVFLEMTAEVKNTTDKTSKGGVGEIHKVSSRLEEETMNAGKDAAKKPGKNQTSTQQQTASDEKKTDEKSEVYKFTSGAMKARILHDAGVPADRLKAVKEVLLALYAGKIKAEDIVLVPAEFGAGRAGKGEASAR